MLDFSANLNPLAPRIEDDLWSRWRESLQVYPLPEPDSIEERLAVVYSISKKRITVLPGAVAGISAVFRLFRSRRVIIPTPSFSEYPYLAHANGLQAECQPLNDWADLSNRLSVREGDIVLLANPNNPTGHWLPPRELAQAITRTSKSVWIVDEAYADFIAADQRGLLPMLEELPNLIVIRSLTKFWNVPGLRLGFVATANTEWDRALRNDRLTWAISSLAEPWSESYLTRDVYNRMSLDLPLLFQWRDRLAADLECSDIVAPKLTRTPYFLVTVEGGAEELWRGLAASGCLLRNAAAWPGLPDNRCLRISPRRPDENSRLVEAVSAERFATV